MYARVAQAITLLTIATSTLVSASPAPIDPQLANVIAVNHNAACTGPEACAGAAGIVNTEDSQTSGALRSVSFSSGVAVAAVTLAGLL